MKDVCNHERGEPQQNFASLYSRCMNGRLSMSGPLNAAIKQETHMSIGNRKVLRQVSSLLALGIIVTNTGYSLAADRQAARGGSETPDIRSGPGHHRPPRGGWVGTLPRGHRPYYYR